MSARLALLVCRHLARETAAALEREGLRDVNLATFPCEFCTPNRKWAALAPLFPPAQSPGDRLYVLGGDCLAHLRSIPPPAAHVHVLHREQCFHFFLSAEVLEQSVRKGAHVLTPGWLADWREYIAHWGFDRQTAHEFFNESASRLLLLDTDVDHHSRQNLADFAEFVGLESEVLPVGLDYYRLTLAKLVADWRSENERRESLDLLSRANRQSADYAMAFDLIGAMTGIMYEEQVVERFLGLFTALFAPTRQTYAAVTNDVIGRVWEVPEGTAPHVRANLAAALALNTDSAWLENEEGFSLRVSHRDETQGILQIRGFAFPEYRHHYLSIAEVMAKICGLAISNARIYQALGNTVNNLEAEITDQKEVERTLRYLSAHDALTGLYNRAYFNEELARLQHSRRYPISIIVADVNDLKRVNDTEGHAAGDRLLQEFAHILKTAFRADDAVARLGGDEFAVVLPGTDAGMAKKLEARVRTLVAEYRSERDGTMSVAVGVATAEQNDSLPQVLQQADERMYANKRAMKQSAGAAGPSVS